MDLSTIAIILIVCFVSFLSILFISRFPKGKSFEEMMEEKKEFREKIMGPSSVGSNKANKDNSNKKTKKVNKKGNKPQKAVPKDSDQDSAEVGSDTNSSDSQEFEEEINPLTYAKKKVSNSVEYVETEAFALNDASSNKKTLPKSTQNKKNKNKGGILVNKAEPVLVKQELATEINHFEEIHPKDAVEIARSNKDEEIKAKAKEQRKGKQSKDVKVEAKETPPISPKNGVAEIQEAPIVVVEVKPVANQNKDKSNKKKKNELITQQLQAEVQDDVNVHSLVRILGKADLPRNEIQILIDFLLNKQQDTLTKDPSEWSDPSDPLQKMKKQLQDKENQLREEQEATLALHAKLKELRTELNADRSQSNAALKATNEELQNKKLEIQNFSQQLTILSEKSASEKQALTIQYQQLQAKFMQYTKEHAAAQDQAQTIQQLNDNIQLLQQELSNKNQIINEKLQFEEELLKKSAEYEKICADYENMLHQKDDLVRQRNQDISKYETDNKLLTADLNRKEEEFVKACQLQKFETDQLMQQVSELQAKQKQAMAAASATAAANNHVDESSKVEIRNLQNALDSSKTELNVYRNDANEHKAKLLEYEKQLKELKVKEDDLYKQLEEQKAKNNDLRTKNWKLVEALQVAPNSTNKNNDLNHFVQVEKMQVAGQQPPSNHIEVDINKIILDEQCRTKEILLKLLPTDITSVVQGESKDFNKWLESTITCIKEQQENIKINNSNDHHLNNSTNGSNSRVHLNDDEEAVGNDHGGDEGNSDKQLLLLHNAQLQTTVDEYKTIIADTESILKNLEAKVLDQDDYWRSVVQSKDTELLLLKSSQPLQS